MVRRLHVPNRLIPPTPLRIYNNKNPSIRNKFRDLPEYTVVSSSEYHSCSPSPKVFLPKNLLGTSIFFYHFERWVLRDFGCSEASMKIQCDSCEAAEANVLCCADKAALCWNCDQKVHAANKLASKHQRVPLSSSLAQMPKCDICQEIEGYFFCLEDRALLCRKCDVTIHKINSLVSAHQRFLLTGVRVGLEATEPSPSCSGKTHSSEKVSETEPPSISKQMTLVSSNGLHNKSLSIQAGLGDHFSSPQLSFEGGVATGGVANWLVEEFLGLGDVNPYYNFVSNDSSKADGGKFGDSDCSPAVRAADGILSGESGDECMDLVPNAFWAVPQIASPHTASGLYWPSNDQNPLDCAVSVPEICTSQSQNFYPHQHQADVTSSKRRRQF